MADRVCFLVDGLNVYHSVVEALSVQRMPLRPVGWGREDGSDVVANVMHGAA